MPAKMEIQQLRKPISRTTVHSLKKAYYQELSPKRKAEEDLQLAISTLPTKKRGLPLLLGEDLDTKVQQYLRALRESGGAINTAIVLGAARGIIFKTKRTVLAEYGGHCLAHADMPILHQLKHPICSYRRGIHEHTLSIDVFTALIIDSLFNAHAHASAVRGKYFLVILHRRK